MEGLSPIPDEVEQALGSISTEPNSSKSSSSSSSSSFPELPFDLVAHILYFLGTDQPQPWTLYNAIQVSRLWAIAGTKLLWKRPMLINTSSARAVLTVLARGNTSDKFSWSSSSASSSSTSTEGQQLPPLVFPYHNYVQVLDLRWSGLLSVVGSANGILGSALEACGPRIRELLLGINAGWVLRGIGTLSRICPNVRVLDVGNFDCGPREIDENVPDRATGVTIMDVDISKFFAVDFFRRFPGLDNIGFSDSWGSRIFEPRMTEEEVDVIADAMAGASVLRLRLGGSVVRLREDSALMLHTIARKTAKLKELQLEDTMTSNDLVMLTFLKNNPGLRSLSISSSLLSKVTFEGIAKLVPNLDKLCFNLRLRWSVDLLAFLLPQLPKLQHLQLNAINSQPRDTASHDRLSSILATTPRNLSTLEISEPTPQWQSFLSPILTRHRETLDVLTVNPHIPLTISDVGWILKQCPGLRRLTVVGQSLQGKGMDMANSELTRTDLNGFTFVFGGREIRRVREWLEFS